MTRKSYIDTTDGQIHYRSCEGGSGPPLVFFHMTAASSEAYEPMMEQLKGKLPTLAFDTVNYGESFRTTREPEMAYIATVLLEALSNLGIEQFHTFGHHTGVSIACEMARIAPGRVLSVSLNGANYTTAEENQWAMDRLAKPNPVTIKGTQFIWAWSRIKDNFPVPLWGDTDVQAQIMHRDATDMLRAGENWHWAYRAVFSHDLPATLAQVRCPLFWLCGTQDLTLRVHQRGAAAFPDARAFLAQDRGVYLIETHPEEVAPELLDFIHSVNVSG